MWRKLTAFLACESAGMTLLWTASLLPRRHGAEIPVLLLLAGIVACFTGLHAGFSLFPGTRAATFHHWSGRVTPPTTGKQEVVWAVAGTVRTHGGGMDGNAAR